MSSLFDLPDELVIDILLHLTNDKPTLRNLSFTCRNASILVRPILFEDIGEISPNPFDQAFKQMSQFNLIRSSLEERPSLGPLVRSVKIRWTTRNSSIHERANKFLEKLPSLRSLSLDIGSGELPFEPSFLQYNKMEFLNSLTLSDSMLTVPSLKSFIWLGQFTSLNILRIRKLDESNFFTDHNLGTSEVVQLHLCAGQHLPYDIFDCLLKTFTKIEKLTCMIPGSCSQGTLSRRVPYVMLDELSPSRVLRALKVSMESMRDLTIHCSRASWPRHDGSRLDLSGFSCLQKISVASRLFFRDTAPRTPMEASTREGLYRLLPNSLKELKIMFERECRFISVGHSSQPAPWHLFWCIELAAHKATCFPGLVSVSLTEMADFVTHVQIPFKMPMHMQEAFQRSNVTFSAVCREPKSSRNRLAIR